MLKGINAMSVKGRESIQNLTESFGYEDAYAVESLLERWEPDLDTISAMTGSLLPLDRRIVIAQALENTQKQLNRAQHLTESTQSIDVNQFKTYGFELLSASLYNLCAFDLCSVQPMKSRNGEIRYIRYLYGTNKGQIRKGDVFNSALSFNGRSHNYTSEFIDGEEIGEAASTSISGVLSFTPVRPYNVKIQDGDSMIAQDDGKGNMVDDKGSKIGTINYETGEITATLTTAPTEAPEAYYLYNLEYAPSQAPELNLEIATQPVKARTRKLRTLYSMDAAYDLMADYGFEINAELIAQAANEIRFEIDDELMTDMLAAGRAQKISDFDITPPTAISLSEHYRDFQTKIIEGSNLINKSTLRANANFMIMGSSVANVVEAMPQFRAEGGMPPVGPHLAGYIGTMPVYKDPLYPDDEYVVGYKGTSLFDAGLVYCPYMPILTTNLTMMDDFVGRKGFVTAYGKRRVNNNYYASGKIILH